MFNYITINMFIGVQVQFNHQGRLALNQNVIVVYTFEFDYEINSVVGNL